MPPSPAVPNEPSQKSSATPSKRPRPQTRWNELARGLLRAEMARHGVGYKELLRRLEEAGGGSQSVTSLITRANRGTFTLAFFLEVASALETRSIDLSHLLENDKKKKQADSEARPTGKGYAGDSALARRSK